MALALVAHLALQLASALELRFMDSMDWLKTMMLETCLSTHVGCSMRNLHANLQKKTGIHKNHHITSGIFCRSAALLLYCGMSLGGLK